MWEAGWFVAQDGTLTHECVNTATEALGLAARQRPEPRGEGTGETPRRLLRERVQRLGGAKGQGGSGKSATRTTASRRRAAAASHCRRFSTGSRQPRAARTPTATTPNGSGRTSLDRDGGVDSSDEGEVAPDRSRRDPDRLSEEWQAPRARRIRRSPRSSIACTRRRWTRSPQRARRWLRSCAPREPSMRRRRWPRCRSRRDWRGLSPRWLADTPPSPSSPL